MKTGLKITLGIVGAIVVSILAYLMFFKKDSKLYVLKGGTGGGLLDPNLPEEIAGKPGAETVVDISPPSGGGMGSFFGGSSGNPFTDNAEVQAFQQFVIDVKKDPSILGNAGADGIWGNNTSKAYKKYGEDYHNQSNPQAKLMENLNSSGLAYTRPNDGSVRVVFTNGDYKYVGRFYKNGRVVFYINGKSVHISKGNYSNGGKKIVIFEGRHKGKTFTDASVLSNLRKAIKPVSGLYSQDGAVGKVAKVKGSHATIRNDNYIDDAGFSQTKIGTVKGSGTVIGKINYWEKKDGHVWYWINNITGAITTSTGATPSRKKGWVRADVVNVV